MNLHDGVNYSNYVSQLLRSENSEQRRRGRAIVKNRKQFMKIFNRGEQKFQREEKERHQREQKLNLHSRWQESQE